MAYGIVAGFNDCHKSLSPCNKYYCHRIYKQRYRKSERVFINGLLYTLGRAITYTAIALIIFLGADQLKFGGFFQRYGEKIVGPLLIIIGLFMLDIIQNKIPGI